MSTITQFPSGNTQYRIEFDYLARTFVVVTLVNSSNPTLNRVLEVGRDYRFLNPTMIEMLVDQSGFDIVRIHRQTGTDLMVDFRNGSVLTASDLTNSELQAIHIAEEGRDQTVDLAKEYADAAGSSAGNAKDSEDEARRIAASIKAAGQIGYITRRSFEKGFNVTTWNEVLLWEEDGDYYRWDGALPKNVPAGSTPESSGGLGLGAWVSVGDASLRSDLSSNNGANLIGLSQGGTVQDGIFTVTPQMYGAVCDGVSDDSAAIQQILNSDATHVIITIPPGSIVRLDNQVTFTGRRLEIRGYSGIMTNKVPTNAHSQLYCNVAGDYAIACTQADIVLKDTLVKGIPAYSMGVIGTQKGLYSAGGSIQTSFVTFMGLALPFSVAGGFYSKFYQTEWLACKDCVGIDKAYNASFFGCRAAAFNRFFPMTGSAGNGPINFYGCAFENFTNYIVGSDTAVYMRYQIFGFHGCYFENFDTQYIYNGLTPRGNAAVPTDAYYNKYAYARIVSGTAWSLLFDSACTVYLKGLENVVIAIDAWAVNHLEFKAKLMESDWLSHQIPLSILRVSKVAIIDTHYNTTASSGVLSCPFLTPNNTSTTPTVTSGFMVVPGKRSVTINGVKNVTLTFTSVAAGVNTYQDITYTDPVKISEALAFVTARSAATAHCQIQLEQLSSYKLRVHVTNTWSQTATFGVRVTIPYQISN